MEQTEQVLRAELEFLKSACVCTFAWECRYTQTVTPVQRIETTSDTEFFLSPNRDRVSRCALWAPELLGIPLPSPLLS